MNDCEAVTYDLGGTLARTDEFERGKATEVADNI